MSDFDYDAIANAEMHQGSHGQAWNVPIPSDRHDCLETCCVWLMTIPRAHPMWNQYQLVVVRLRDGVEGFPPPVRQFEGATHELLILAIDPAQGRGGNWSGRWTLKKMADAFVMGGSVPYLSPVNLVLQFEATDEEMRACASLVAKACCDGRMTPEAPLGRESFTRDWLISLTKTLAHCHR